MAAAYSLPADIGANGSPFKDCSGAGPVYTCTKKVEIGANDTVTLTANVTLDMDGNEFKVKKNGGQVDQGAFVFNVTNADRINIEGPGPVIMGTLTASGKVEAKDGVVLTANMVSTGDEVKVKDGSTVTGNLTSQTDKVKIEGAGNTVTGTILADDNVEITGGNNTVTGDVTSQTGDVIIEDGNTTINGNIDATTGNVDISGGNNTINGDITANGGAGTLTIAELSTVVTGTCNPDHPPQCGGGGSGPSCSIQQIALDGEEFRGIHGISDSDIYAVGKDGSIYHYDGSSWSETFDSGDDLNDVYMVSSSLGYAVGKDGDVFEFNGTTWNQLTAPTGEDLEGVWAFSSTEVWVVGKKDALYRWNGASWQDMSGGGQANVDNNQDLRSAWGGSTYFYALEKDGDLYQYTRTAGPWNKITACENAYDMDVRDIWGDDSGNLYIAGKNKDTNPDEATVFVYNESGGTCSVEHSSATENNLDSVYGNGSTLYAVGKDSLVVNNSSGSWTETVDGNDDYKAVWVSPTNIAYYAGKDGMITTCTPATGSVDHYYVQNAATGVNCQAENITITAHDAAHDPVNAEGNLITITAVRVAGTAGTRGDYSVVTGTGTLDNGAADDGIATYTFGTGESAVVLSYKNTWEQTINIDVTDGTATDTSGTAAADPGYDQDLAFAAAGFRFVDPAGPDSILPNQIAGVTAGSYDLQAIETASCTTPGTCTGVCTVPSAFGNGEIVDIDLAFTCDNPVTCQAGQQVSVTNNGVTPISANPATGPTAWTTKSMQFGADGRASFDMVYPDVGALSLHARYDIPLQGGGASGSLMTGQSNSFVVAPFGFVISETAPNEIKRTSDGFVNPGASTAAGPPFMVAGDDFSVTVTAVNQSGGATPNYGQEISPESVRLTANLASLPGLTNNPAIVNPTAFGSFTGGAATGTTFSWGEVGIITLTPSVGDADYLGAGNVIGTDSGNVGRFYPSSFTVDSIINDGVFGEGCVAFTYLGQDFSYATAPSFRVEALNLNSVTTTNYSSDFAKLVTTTNIGITVSQDDTKVGTDLLALEVAFTQAAEPAPIANGDGTVDVTLGADVYRYGPSSVTSFSKSSNSEVSEFTADINPDITSVGDGEASSSFTPGTYVLNPDGNLNRFGRLRMKNTLGSELSPLTMPAFVEFVNMSGVYEKSQADACTAISDSDLIIQINALVPASSSIPTVINPLMPVLGDIDYLFPAPSPAATGYITIDTELDNTGANQLWLRYNWDDSTGTEFSDNPSATASFGVYQGNEFQIFQQQTFQ